MSYNRRSKETKKERLLYLCNQWQPGKSGRRKDHEKIRGYTEDSPVARKLHPDTSLPTPDVDSCILTVLASLCKDNVKTRIRAMTSTHLQSDQFSDNHDGHMDRVISLDAVLKGSTMFSNGDTD